MMKKLKQKLISRSSKKTDEEEWFFEHGWILLEKLIADCNGESVPIRNFSSSQILKATNNFDNHCLVKTSWDWDKEWYKGHIEDKLYLIKRLLKDSYGYAFNDIVFSARMSNHNNFLKLLGCCYEFSFMVAVFEYEELVALTEEGRIIVNGEESILPWNVRLHIAKEVAIAVTYLHTAFPRIIIHKDIEPSNILLIKNKNWKAKLTDFRFSVSLPQGKSKIQDDKVSGTYGYMDPLYHDSASLSEYTDVYSFGICLLVFLTGRPASSLCKEYDPNVDVGGIVRYMKGLYENGKLDEVIDPMMEKDITSNQRPQIEAFIMLALRCCEEREEDRPKMIQVAKELKQIHRSF